MYSQWKYRETKNVDIKDDYRVVTYSYPSEKNKNVKYDEIKKTVDLNSFYPLSSSSEPSEDVSFLGIAAVGYAKVVGPYYEGFNSAATIRLGAFYSIGAPWFIGFNYGYSSITGDQIPRSDINSPRDRKCINLSFNEYSLGAGGFFNLFSDNVLYGLVGFAVVSQTQKLSFTGYEVSFISGQVIEQVKDYGTVETTEDLFGVFIEAGLIIPVNNKINAVLSFNFTLPNVQKYHSSMVAVYSDGSSSAINDENNGIFKMTAGIMYAF
jgi:hypothetical protein